MKTQKINMTIGRFQPFTQGHLNMVNEGDGPCIIYRINSSNKLPSSLNDLKVSGRKVKPESIKNVIQYINNPTGDLTEQEKELLKRPFTNELIDKELNIVKRNNKNIIDVVPVKNMFDALDRFNAFCTEHPEYEPQYWMCGDDRVDQYTAMIDKYDELETELGSGQKLPNVLKGKLITNIGKGRTKGVSGTAVRASILNKDKSTFSRIMPRGVDGMFDDFVNAFDDFKTQLQKIIKEHRMMSLKEYIFENIIDTQLEQKVRYRLKNIFAKQGRYTALKYQEDKKYQNKIIDDCVQKIKNKELTFSTLEQYINKII